MAGNNYFGFTHGATQYTPTGTNAYQAGQTSYAVAHQGAAGNTYAAQRAGGPTYDPTYHASAQQSATYVAAAAAAAGSSNTPYDYGYARSAAAAYDGTKSYYQQPAVPTTFTSNETHYQVKPSYNNTANYAGNQRNASNIPNKPYAGYGAPNYSNIPTNVKTPGKANVPTLYTAQPTGPVAASKSGAWQQNYKRGTTQNKMKPKAPPKPQQLHYCDICKISCAGPQTYREHLEGQKHKKKEAGLKGGSTTSTPRGGNSLRCELCDVTCTGSDAYAAHIRGAKHQKVVKLHTKLGKPIPSTEPVVVTSASKTSSPTITPGTNSICTSPGNSMVKKPTGVPKINFVGGAKLSINVKEEKPGEKLVVEEEKLLLNSSIEMKLSDEKEIQPVGLDYIEEIRNEEGKIVSFNCKLCECRFNDPNAKEMHMKGRRHRLQYKKKVNPDLVVEVKPSLRQRKLQEEKFRRQALREELWRLYSRYSGPMQPPLNRPFPPSPMMGPPPVRRPDTSDDRHVIARHGEIYPKEGGLSAIQTIVSNTEKALKLVSDFLADQANKVDGASVAAETPDVKPDVNTLNVPSVAAEPSVTENNVEAKKESELSPRILKGVMRVGILAKGLLLHNDSEVQLVVLCSEKPGLSLLSKLAECLPEQLSVVAPENSYETVLATEQAAVIVKSSQEPRISVTVTLTSPVMREQNLEAGDSQAAADVKDPPDVLDKHKCLEALAALRHAKWFQARANGLQSCVMVIRILRDLCQRVPTWAPLNTWAMELLCERVISSAGQPLSPGDALRRVFEALAAGILLPGSPGLQDPCEKEPVDAAAYLSSQDREDITASAQFALRLIAFRQIHKVLGMEPLPLPKFGRGRFTRKRRRDNSVGEGNDSEGRDASEAGDGKKDKKDEQVIDKMETDLVKEKPDVVGDVKLEIVK